MGKSTLIYGLDLSLSATGFASLDAAGAITLTTVRTLAAMRVEPRLSSLVDQIERLIVAPELVVIEGLSSGSNDPSAQERAALHYMVRHVLWVRMVQFVVVAPTSLKKFVTGSGRAKKEMVIREVYRRWKVEAADNNQADAAGLAYIGAAIVGQIDDLTLPQKEVVSKLTRSN